MGNFTTAVKFFADKEVYTVAVNIFKKYFVVVIVVVKSWKGKTTTTTLWWTVISIYNLAHFVFSFITLFPSRSSFASFSFCQNVAVILRYLPSTIMTVIPLMKIISADIKGRTISGVFCPLYVFLDKIYLITIRGCLYIVCHWFRLMKQDDYFWDKFDHFLNWALS